MPSGSGFLARRLLHSLLVILGITFVAAAMIRLVPGDPVDIMAAGNPGMTEADKDNLRAQLGLTTPLPQAFVGYVANAVHGDLGMSLRQRAPVTGLILERLPQTAELSLWALVISIAIAIPLGTITALRRNGVVDYAGTTFAVLGISTPGFLLGILLILLFSVELRLLPSSGFRGSALMAIPFGPAAFWAKFRYFILPATSLAFALTAINARLTRSAMLEVLSQEFVLVARAKGLKPWTVVVRHALRNAIIPVITVAGLQFGGLLSGAIVTETVFAWPGVGRLAVQAIQWRDYPLVQGTVLVSATLFVALNFFVDVLYVAVDPRLRDA
ncbi:MAG TPA: ABC transporter permease [Acetobacteraceae bacterium]|jgi:peptide/nickel transport system permease protein|nr:ABC transporter permease [Acetobacteraceae bacterium]